jgi:Cu/Ag efflux protein CusF
LNRATRGVAALALAPLLCLLLSCSGSDSSNSTSVDQYVVRALLVRPVDAQATDRVVWLRHEAIPNFVGINGEIESMDSMTMSFFVGDNVDLDGLEKGDKIEFELTVDWSEKIPGKVTAIKVLPDETLLSFEATG